MAAAGGRAIHPVNVRLGGSPRPRGALYHRYLIGADGLVAAARIVPPTPQNQAAIEAGLRDFVQAHIGLAPVRTSRTTRPRSATSSVRGG
jgi:coenzyme F420-reducing hydrogenase alpha subunit